MAKLFFRLRLVPEDEAEDVRQMLDENLIDWYETSAGRWGISFPAIWLRNSSDHEKAAGLLHGYQHERKERIRAEQQASVEQGEHETVISRFSRHPIRSIAALGVIFIVVYFSISPFFSIVGN